MAAADLSDVDLVAAMSERDEGALRMLYERHAGWISARLRRRCADREVVVDVLQDTFVSAWGAAARFRGDGDVAAWLWGIAIHRLISRVRTRSARAPRLGPALLPHDGADESAEEQVLVAIEYSDVGSALARISPELRVVLQATVLDGLTTREAAHLLGIPQGTVKSAARKGAGQDEGGTGMTTERGGWHVDADALQALADGGLGQVLAASVEAHVMRCDGCRAELNALEFGRPEGGLERAWTGVRDSIEPPASGPVARWLSRLGFRTEQLRLLSAVPALRGSWLIGVTLALLFTGAAATFAGDRGGLGFFLLVAPLAPVAGVAMAFGGDADPSQEIVVTTPFSAVRLLLLRTAAVVATSVPIAMLVGLFVPGPGWLFVAWLTPAAACVAVTLALSPYAGPTNSGAVVGAVWSVLTLAATQSHGDPLVLVGPASQWACTALVLLSVSVLVTKFHIIDLPRRQS